MFDMKRKPMKSDFEDYLIDAKLHIETTGRDDRYSDPHIYPYEATTYTVLDRLISSDLISDSDCLLDYGCGKGRVPIYLSHRTGCRSIGIEYIDVFYKKALCNLSSYRKYYPDHPCDIRLIEASAASYAVPDEVTRIFFFNPFSVEILTAVMKRLLQSCYDHQRNVLLFFYYPQDAYMAHLTGLDELSFYDEIDCTDLFTEQDSRNRIMIFEVTGQAL